MNRSNYVTQKRTGLSGIKLFLLTAIPFLVVIISVISIFALVIGIIYYSSKNTYEFSCAMQQIRENKEAEGLLGENIKDGYLILPNIEISGARRDVQFSVPVSGSRSAGTLKVISYRDGFRSDFAMMLETDKKNVEIYRGTYPCSE